MIDLKHVYLLYANIRCVSKPVGREYADRLLDAPAVFAIAEPNVLSSGVQLQVIYGRSELVVDDVEVFSGRPVVPQVHERQLTACPVLKQDCMKLLGPNGGRRDSSDKTRTSKRARVQQYRLWTHATAVTTAPLQCRDVSDDNERYNISA